MPTPSSLQHTHTLTHTDNLLTSSSPTTKTPQEGGRLFFPSPVCLSVPPSPSPHPLPPGSLHLLPLNTNTDIFLSLFSVYSAFIALRVQSCSRSLGFSDACQQARSLQQIMKIVQHKTETASAHGTHIHRSLARKFTLETQNLHIRTKHFCLITLRVYRQTGRSSIISRHPYIFNFFLSFCLRLDQMKVLAFYPISCAVL